MKLDAIHISGFGKFHDWNCETGPGITIIKGNNEAGKTTLAAYIRFILFGFPKRSRDNRYPPLDGGNHGGIAEFTLNNGSKITVDRILRGNQPVRVVTPDHKAGGEENLKQLLGGVDADLFRKIFSINQDEIPGSDLLTNEHVRSMLHGAEMGMTPGVIEHIRSELISEMEAIYKPAGRAKRINDQLNLIKTIDEDIRDYYARSLEYDQLNSHIQSSQNKIGLQQNKKNGFKERLEYLSKIIGLQKDYDRYVELWGELRNLQGTEKVPDGALEQFKQLNTRREGIQKRIDTIRENIPKSAVADLPSNWEIYIREKEKILGLWRDKNLYEKNISLLSELEDNIRKNKSELERIPQNEPVFTEKPGILFSEPLPSNEDVILRSTPLMDASKNEIEFQNQIDEVNRELSDHKISFDETRTTYLKIKEFEKSKASESTNSNYPLMAAGLIIIGVILPIIGIVSSQILIIAGLLVIGIFCIIAGIVLYSKSSSRVTTGPIDQEESNRLKSLLISKKNRYDQMMARLEELTAESKKAESIRESQVREWESWLTSYHIPVKLAPEQVSELFSRIGKVKMLSDNIQTTGEKIQNVQNDVSSFENEVTSLTDILQYPISENTSDLIETINQNYQSVERQIKERSGSVAIEGQLARDLEDEGNALQDLNKELSDLLMTSGCTTEDEFLSVSSKIAIKEQYEQEQRIILERFSGIPGTEGTADMGLEFLKSTNFTNLANEKEQIEGDLHVLEDLIYEANEEIGRYKRDCEQIETDTSGADLRIQRDVAVNTVQHLTEQWSVYKTAISLLDEAIKKYEDKRQPAVVQEAENIFSEITDGRYQTIIIPASKPEIYVKDMNGNQREIGQLSRGTAEQLYLALRFGYIREFQKSAENMPIILDEILVNFDPDRTRVACKAIARMAETNQILYFTCHPEDVANIKEAIPHARIIDLNQDAVGGCSVKISKV